MAYVALCKALYDYAAQDQDELTLTEDATLYILEADDPEWWKAKLRRLNPDGTPVEPDDDGADGQVGLVPANYVEEAEPLRLSRVLYDYEAQTEDELSIAEDELLRIYETDGLWLLVKRQGDDPLSGGEGRLGYVPANYVDEAEAVDTGAAPVVDDGPVEAEEDDEDESYAAASTHTAIPRISMLPSADGKGDEIKMWPVSALDSKKKKKKGTLGIGSASLFFASESDKTPVQKISILHIVGHSLEKGKNLHLELSPDSGSAESTLDFHTGSKDAGSEIVKKIELSQAAAQSSAAASTSADPAASGTSIPAPPQPPQAPAAPAFQPPPLRTASAVNLPPPVRKTVSFQQQQQQQQQGNDEEEAAAVAAASGEGEEPAIALYDFEAQGDDELSVAENEALVVLEKENDDWWKVRNAQGEEGVVPASYVELSGGTAPGSQNGADAAAVEDEEERRRREEEADEAAAAAAAERQRKAAERRRQEAEDRAVREAEEQSRREALKAQPAPEPPKMTQRASTTKVNRAARNVAIPQGRSAPERPKDGGGRSKPKPSKTRMWNDRTGQFKVEAEFLGFNQGKIRLHKMNGVVIEVAIEKMSDADIQWLEDITGKKLMPSEADLGRRRESSSRLQAQPSSSGGGRDRSERERERRREKEREQRRREHAGHGGGPKRNVDWFEFFLAAGVDVDDCTRYAAAFERDKIDETVIADLEPSTLRSLGLREGDIIRVGKFIVRKYRRSKQPSSRPSTTGGASASTAADLEKQIKADEELARKLQEQDGGSARRSGAISPQPPQLYSGPDGALKNNTRRGRPTPKAGAGSVDAASESLARSTTASPPGRASTVSPAVVPKRTASTQPAAASGFDDDAWTPRPPSTKPATPAAALPAPTPPPAPPAASAAAAAPTPSPQPPADPNSALFEKLAAMRPPSAASGASPRPGAIPTGQNSFLGSGNSYNPNAARGPFAPVPANQGLLQPLIPTSGTGQFVPTKMQGQPTGMMRMQMTGIQPQQTGYMGIQQMQQPQMMGFNGSGMGMGSGFGGSMNSMTGMGGGLQSQATRFVSNGSGFGVGARMGGYSSPSPQFGGQMNAQPTGFGGMQPQQTGFMGMQQQQLPQQTGFGGFDQPSPQQQQQKLPQQQQQQDDGNKFNASNIFQQMKTGQFAKDPNSQAQAPQKYDALRPQPTGFQPGGVMQPQFTGMNFGQPAQQQGYQQQQQQQQGGYGGFGGSY